MSEKTVAVIGAGISGLTAVKACIEEGLAVVCFEKSESIGGLWHYHDDSEDGRPSVMKSTIINTHKEMTAFSDFPPPASAPNYMHNSRLLDYFREYAAHFRLEPHIRLQQEVLQVFRAPDYDRTGKWVVVSRSLQGDGVTTEETFDGVMVCSGHHAYQARASFPGQEQFRGKIVHSHSVKTPDAFRNLNVLVVGIGNSGVDCAVDISTVAKQVYLSTRRGAWVIPRCGPRGLPMDCSFNSRSIRSLFSVLSWDRLSRLMESLVIDPFFDHSMYGLRPGHRFLSQHPTINDHLPSRILAGRISVRKDIQRFTSEGVFFEKEEKAVPIDSVVLATGYKISFPFIKEPFAEIRENEVDFYKLTFPPHLEHPTLAFIGLCQPMGSIMPISEAQSRWFSLVMSGKVKLPPPRQMISEIRNRRREMAEQFVASPRHTVQVDYVWFMDDICSEFGARPNLLKMVLSDPKLFWSCFLGPCLPYQYRLQGPHSWAGARQAILDFPKRVCKPLAGGISKPQYGSAEAWKMALPILFFIISVLLNIYLFVSILLK